MRCSSFPRNGVLNSMLDLTYLRENIQTARERLGHRGFSLDVETFQRLDSERKSLIQEVERLRQTRNTTSEEIGRLAREKVDVTEKRNEMKVVSQRIKELEESLQRVEEQLYHFAAIIPNLPDPSVPIGPTDEQNVEVRRVGEPPRFDFKPKDHDYYLIPTAEVPVTNIYRDDIIDGDRLPIKFTAYTPCFRSEAGSYGKDVRGVFRQHQFNKVELVKFTRQEQSNTELESLVTNAEEILKRLKIAYRVVIHSTGDMGFSASKSYDIEVWLPGQNAYREISSCSNFEYFQARRANIRYRPAAGEKVRFAHTLNGSGLAIGRTWIAIMENYQQKDGTVVIPEALRPYLGGLSVIQPQKVI